MKNTPSIIYVFYILILILPCSELALRILGYRPYQQQEFHIKASPENCIIAHPKLGFALHPGQFEVTINKGLHYNVRHKNDSLRFISNKPELENIQDSIYFFGCSYTYGMGISDSLTLPYLVQKNRPNSYIRNFAVPGYGTIQSYLQLNQLISTQEIPSIIIINYAHFHDDRNALTPAYRRDLYLGYQRSHESVDSKMQKSKIPFVQKEDGDYQFTTCKWADIYHSWPQRETFALVNFMQDVRDQKQARSVDKEAATLFIFKQIKTLCDRHQIRMIVTGLTPSERTTDLLMSLDHLAIETLDISVNLSLNKFHNAPYDDHPNGRAHAVFAEKIVAYLSD